MNIFNIFTWQADSCGWTVYCNGKALGGARTLGTATRTADGRPKHWRNREKDIAMHRDTARRTCEELAAGRGPEYLKKNIPESPAAHEWNALTWLEKQKFLTAHSFPLGWSSHTWKYLPREIQSAFEVSI